MKTFEQLVAEALRDVEEIFPCDLMSELEFDGPAPLLLDVREPAEYQAAHIEGALHVPRGVLEPASEYGFEETEPALAEGREEDIVVICRSGRRSALAVRTLKELGFLRVRNLKLGIRGWNDDGGPLVDHAGNAVDPDRAEVVIENPAAP